VVVVSDQAGAVGPDSPTQSPPPHPNRRLDVKLDRIIGGTYTPDHFVIADAKDADMAYGTAAAGARSGRQPGPNEAAAPGVLRTRGEYLEAMRNLIDQGELDIMLTSASNGERLALGGDLDRDPGLTLAVRGNDTTCIWNNRGSQYTAIPSRPFATANLEAIRPFCDLVLYSITFNNELELDLAGLEAYARFRERAAEVGMRHFLEVFNPNAPVGLDPNLTGAFVNDSIVRALAGVTSAHRPLFLKMAYNGSDALSELAEHDPTLVIGVLGGSSGTTRDTFELLHQAEVHGARVALFGRKIQRSESQLDLVRHMRLVVRGELSPAEGVASYHDALGAAGLSPHRSLEEDLEITEPVLRQ
jgi:hypothetical protein